MSRSLSLDQVRQQIYRPVDGPRDALPRTVDVVVVGGGPVGLTVANLLGYHGINALLLEKNLVTSEMPKAIILDDEFMRLLDSLGLAKPMQEHVVGPVGIDFLSPFGFILTSSPGAVTPNGFSSRSCMAQPMFEKVLLEGVRQYDGVKVRFGVQLTGLQQDEETVALTVRSDDQSEATITAKFVVACDGSHSFVRRILGLQFPGSHLQSPRMVIDLAEFPDQSLDCRYWCNPTRPINSIPAPYGGRRLEVMLNPGETAEEITRPETIRRIVARHTPYAGVDLKIARAVVYDFSERVADRLSVGRVFLLGDAAHIMPPSGGQGLNSGARDAANLAWKLSAVLSGKTSPTVLNSYHVERWNHVKAVVAYAVRLGAFANVRSWPRSLLRDLAFAVGRFVPPLRRRLTADNAPKPHYQDGLFVFQDDLPSHSVGRIFPRLTLAGRDGSTTSLDQLAGPNFALVGIDVPGPELERLARQSPWDALGVKSVSVATSDLAPGDASQQPTYALQPAGQIGTIRPDRGRVLVVRPDRYVAAVSTPGNFGQLSQKFGGLLGLASNAHVV